MVLLLPLHGDAAGSPMQGVPDLQQDALAVLPPLMVPKAQFLDSLRRQKFFAFLVMLALLGQPMLEPVQLDG